MQPEVASEDKFRTVAARGKFRLPRIAVEATAAMVRQAPDLSTIELHLEKFVGVEIPAGRRNRIAGRVGFEEYPAIAVRR